MLAEHSRRSRLVCFLSDLSTGSDAGSLHDNAINVAGATALAAGLACWPSLTRLQYVVAERCVFPERIC